MAWLSKVASLLWHAPGRTWAGMMASGSLSLWLTAGAGMAWTMMTAALVILFKPVLGSDEAFWIIMGALGVVFLAIGAMAGQEISLGISRAGLNLNVGQDDVKAVVETKTTVSTKVEDLPPWQR